MKLGIICSSGGSSIFKAVSFFKYKRFKLFIVTDRNFKIIEKFKKKNIFVKKIKYNKNFDEKVKYF